MIKRLALALVILVLAAPSRGMATMQIFGSRSLIAFASVSVDSGSDIAVKAFGGAGAKGVAAVRNSPGHYTVTFTGHWRPKITADSLIVFSSAKGGHFSASGAIADFASKGQIVIEVSTWQSNVPAETDNDFQVAVLEGLACFPAKPLC
ncbi:MAG TPA: hypothetical protein VMU16_00425 [Candidatus Binataceae bacterium]|nr:hypothetical protein [Candidatus Binataceae bacterium]